MVTENRYREVNRKTEKIIVASMIVSAVRAKNDAPNIYLVKSQKKYQLGIGSPL
jgi:hypothetical protein